MICLWVFVMTTLIFESLEQEEKRRQTLIFSATMTFVHAGPQRSIKKRVQMTVDSKLDKLIKEIGLTKKPAIVDLSRKEGTAEKVVETRLVVGGPVGLMSQ